MEALPRGTYPMLYSFFDDRGRLRYDAFEHQAEVILANPCAGAAILGLGTEVSKLSDQERIAALTTTAKKLNHRRPLLVTVYGDSTQAQIEFAQRAIDLGAAALILQPPATTLTDDELMAFFATVIESLDYPVGIQNAPEFLGSGRSIGNLSKLSTTYEHFTMAKLECTAVMLQHTAENLTTPLQLFNGKCGLELPDNLRAGASGIIPGFETIDKTAEIFRAFDNGNESQADDLYQTVLPTLCFIRQGIPHFIVYGKLLAAQRLGIDTGGSRNPALEITPFGNACIKRIASTLGKLTT